MNEKDKIKLALEKKDEIRLVGEMYGILLEIKANYDLLDTNLNFDEYLDKQLEKLKKEALEWLIEDDRQQRQEIEVEQEVNKI